MKREFKFKNGKKLEVRTIYGIGKNYAKHAAEFGGGIPEEPIIFIKPPVSYIENGGVIKLPAMSNNVHHEVELVVVIGKDCANIPASSAREYIAGYAVGIDVTMRDIQFKAKEKGEPWAVAKGFYSSAPISEVIPAEEFGEEIPNFELILKVNNEIIQNSSTKFMERSVATLIEYLSKIFTLEEGDCIFTGTPEGVGRIQSGDKIYAELSGFVTLNVIAE
jgi:2-keto-4-pentenoate hydratase/2-oxohepta-3-ene-1,7-dioic acid hydratase in catechol pathway